MLCSSNADHINLLIVSSLQIFLLNASDQKYLKLDLTNVLIFSILKKEIIKESIRTGTTNERKLL